MTGGEALAFFLNYLILLLLLLFPYAKVMLLVKFRHDLCLLLTHKRFLVVLCHFDIKLF